MRIRLWMIVLGIGLAGAVVMSLKRRQHADESAMPVAGSDSFEGAAAIRKNVTGNGEMFEGAAAIRSEPASSDEGLFEGAAAIREEPAG